MLNCISKEKPKKWNQTAIDCFNKKCNCSICHLNKIYFEVRNIKCQMKYYVIEMLKLFGKPYHEKN